METVNIKIDIEVITHQNVVEHPHVQILINNKVQFDNIMEHSDIINFNVELEEDQQHKLTIVYDNKDSLSYTTTDPQGENTTGFDATKLSWNGSTILLFESPIYIWILENL